MKCAFNGDWTLAALEAEPLEHISDRLASATFIFLIGVLIQLMILYHFFDTGSVIRTGPKLVVLDQIHEEVSRIEAKVGFVSR